MEIKEIENLANLCRINLSQEEKGQLLKDMDSILGFVDQIQTIDIDKEKKITGNLRNVLREDEKSHESGEFTDSILSEAPKKENGYFKVKKIL
ncbi:MAG: Asp-tRNA(Asn)/Glu-tRNA(Gln) amidotransferase subunit GatC [Patescibacteria group bacterium]|nr:Asp-tRNA(Asn)/Glu-tRNA(Gln) amidotransferase subunit GatC [Patescibacteria group bacterium]